MLYKNKNIVLHITNTDISKDPRVIKEIDSIKKIKNLYIYGVGVSRNNIFKKNKSKNYIQILFKLDSKKFFYFSNLLKDIEIVLKIYFIGLKIKPDIIHCHDAIALIPCFLLNIFRKTKIIYDAHELESDKNGQSKLFKVITLFFESIMWKKINLLISVSPSIINWYKVKYGFKKSLLLLNKPRYNKRSQKEIDLKKIFNIDQNHLLFIYIGDLCHGRGIKLILEAFSKYKRNSSVVFLGDGILKELIFKYSNKYNNIFYHNMVPHHEVVSLTKSCDVGLCLIEDVSISDHLCLPNKLFEYASAGINIISSELPEIVKFIRKYKVGKVTKYNIESLNKQINFFENKGIIKLNINTENFIWESQELELIKSYQRLLR